MSQLQVAIRVVELIIGTLVVLLIGDYLGYKMSRRKLVLAVGIVALVTIIIFAIYAAVVLA